MPDCRSEVQSGPMERPTSSSWYPDSRAEESTGKRGLVIFAAVVVAVVVLILAISLAVPDVPAPVDTTVPVSGS